MGMNRCKLAMLKKKTKHATMPKRHSEIPSLLRNQAERKKKKLIHTLYNPSPGTPLGTKERGGKNHIMAVAGLPMCF